MGDFSFTLLKTLSFGEGRVRHKKGIHFSMDACTFNDYIIIK
jgi:hypothetical protein